MARFPDSRISAPSPSSQTTASSDCPEDSHPRDVVKALPAYSGGTVWAFHPLRVAAGASVEWSLRIRVVPKPHAGV